jgi:hypothetical protein
MLRLCSIRSAGLSLRSGRAGAEIEQSRDKCLRTITVVLNLPRLPMTTRYVGRTAALPSNGTRVVTLRAKSRPSTCIIA